LGCLATVLRFLPLPMGASAFFLIPILVGHIFGGVIGLLNAMLSMLMSGFWGGGLGPWTPYQIMASGLIGLISGMTVGRSKWSLAFVAFSMGILYGILMNIWAWPTLPDQNGSFVLFYVTTSLWWDVFRGVANSTLVIIFYEPITKILTRFKARFLTDLDINLSSLS
ncbi:MAG: ECF transporter S component, partial [Bdellovibrionales bacterium]|nr:ECF transporter S component [Bdellovibrionales bacterium]